MATDKDADAPATNDAYTGMLAIALLALIGGCVLLYLDYSQYPDSKQPPLPKAPGVVTPAEPKAEETPKANPPKAETPADKK